MGIRYLLLAAAIWVLYILLRRLLAGRRKGRSSADAAPVNMVSCAHCGIHVPQPEALEKNGHFYCCREHMQLGKREE
jgi:uncharacterized protein